MRVDICVCWYLRDLVLCGLYVVLVKDYKDGYIVMLMNKKLLKNFKCLRVSFIFMDIDFVFIIRERFLFIIYLFVGNC